MADTPETPPPSDSQVSKNFEAGDDDQRPNNPIARRMGRPKGSKDKRKRIRRPRLPQVEEIRALTGNASILAACANIGLNGDRVAMLRGMQHYIMALIIREVHNKDVPRRQCWRDLLWTLHQMEVITSRDRAILASDITPPEHHSNGSRAVDLGDFKLNSELE